MIIQLIILLILTFSFLILFAYIATHKNYLIQKYNNSKKDKKEKEEKNYNMTNSNKGIFSSLKNYFSNDYIIYSKPKSKKEKTFTVLSYNILTQKYLHKTIKENKFLEKKIRLVNVVLEIKQINPEIFCLQEATDDIIKSHIKKHFELNYNIIHYENEGSSLINVIGIKKDRFEIMNESRVIICDDKIRNISNTNKDENEEDNEDNFIYNHKIHVKGNRGIINVCIKDKMVNNKIINLFCVHFPWKPEFEYQKARIMGLIFDLILRKKIPNVIIAGDFNSVPNSIVLRMIYYQDWEAEMNQNQEYINSNFIHNKKESDLIKETLDKMEKRQNFELMIKDLMKLSKEVWDKYKMKSAYDYYRNEVKNKQYGFLRNHPKYTNYTNKFIDTLDYIFYSNSLVKLKILKIPDIEKERNNTKEKIFLPNENHPSDHLKLVANFEYKN